MGCLIEFICEVLLEGVIELVGYCYIKLMTLVVPERAVTDKYRKKIRNIVTVFAVIVALVLIFGFIFWMQSDLFIKQIGKWMTVSALGVMGVQMALGLIVWALTRKKK